MDQQSEDCSDTASMVSGSSLCGSSSSVSSDSSLSDAAPAVLDPVLSVPIPPVTASPAEIREAHLAHVSAADRQFSTLTAPSPPPDEVVRCVERLASAGPEVTIAKRRAFLSSIRSAAAALAPSSASLLASSPAHVRAVNPKAHPALLTWCLDQCLLRIPT